MKAHVKLILDDRHKRKDGKVRISMRLTHNRVPVLAATEYVVDPNDWDPVNFKIIFRKDNKEHVTRANNKISRMIIDAEDMIDYLTNTGEIETMSAADLKAKVLNKSKRVTFRSFNQKIIDELKLAKRLGNASCYEQAQRFLDKYTDNAELTFQQINFRLLKKLESEHLAKENSLNSLSFYLRTIRATYNRAMKEGIVKRDNYPFANYSIKDTKPAKRAIKMSEIGKIRDIKLPVGTSIWNARNYFMFSFYNIGMNFADIAHLKKTDIINNRIDYTRTKTGRKYSIKLNPPAKAIINLYKKTQADSEYVFPIIKRDTIELQLMDLQNERKTFNQKLKIIQKKCKIKSNLTSYVARHSWATIAKNLNVPVSVISEGLGHEDIKTTQIYLDSFDDKVIDKANALISK